MCLSTVPSGAEDGAIRLHDACSRRTRGVLRKHAGAVVQLRAVDGKLVSRSGERIVVWDAATVKAVRGFAGGAFAASCKEPDTVYALVPGDGCSIRVYDARQKGVAAVLSLPRTWGRWRVGEIALTPRGDLVAAVGDAYEIRRAWYQRSKSSNGGEGVNNKLNWSQAYDFVGVTNRVKPIRHLPMKYGELLVNDQEN